MFRFLVLGFVLFPSPTVVSVWVFSFVPVLLGEFHCLGFCLAKVAMVQLMNSEMMLCPEKLSVKWESDDSFEDGHVQLNKRCKPEFYQWNSSPDTFPETSSHYNPLDEPSPLGLSLRKSPSLLDLIQMKLSQGTASTTGAAKSEAFDSMFKNGIEGTTMSGTNEKLKASNFPASHLKIGCWEYKSRYEGDLVAKCYYAKHKLVWEILEGGLKSKIEIQWSDIMALKANCPDDGPATLNIVLARQPLFYRETNPQPRKHTLWQATADFTDGEASLHRQHFLQCPQGLLNKHFEKLIQSDSRLNFLSQQPEIVLGSPYFEARASVFESPRQASIYSFTQAENDNQSIVCAFQDVASPSAQSSLKVEQASPQILLEHRSLEVTSPGSVMDTHSINGNKSNVAHCKTPKSWGQIKVPGLHPSMSMSDIVNHIGHHLTEKIISTNSSFIDDGSEYQDMLNEIAVYLLSDNQLTATSDEVSLMSRVNSLCCLLQKEPVAVQSSQASGESCAEGPDYKKDSQLKNPAGSMDDVKSNVGGGEIKCNPKETKDVSGSKQEPAMSRKDSFGDLLLHLPRIASLPKFLFNILEDGKSQDK